MGYLYLLLNLGSISIPFIFSFHPKLKFYKHWKSLGIGLITSMLIFIPWDVFFTKYGIWGFNEHYFFGTKLFGLPIEEWLFFICIPYACVFTHYALLHYFPKMQLHTSSVQKISYVLIGVFCIVVIFNYDKWYTLINFSMAILVLALVFKKNANILQTYYLTFLVMLIPFFIVNGILTGSFIENEVVWYNNNENLGIRLLTIPIEDTVYAFTLILINLYAVDYFKRSKNQLLGQ